MKQEPKIDFIYDDVVTLYEHDALGRVVRTAYGSSLSTSPRNFVEVEYDDGIESVHTTIDTRGVKTKSYYDMASRLVKTEADVDELKATSQYTYDLTGQLLEDSGIGPN